MEKAKSLIPFKRIEQAILILRDQKVMLDEDLANLYGVSTKRLNEQVQRNIGRFPADFMFQLSYQEFRRLKSQIATSKRGGRRTLPRAFTEHGALMLASVLNSPIAVEASIEVVRAFVRLRQMIASHDALAKKIAALERKYDSQFKVVFEAIHELMTPPAPKKKSRIGF